ncbi:MAG: Crp/Fnr family transcriptional regulator [Nitrospirae bacterium]|nr:Crp/Fnr family transcriptional regulator [Nitrospirota bacterium]
MANCEGCRIQDDCFFSGAEGPARESISRRLVTNRYKKNQVILYEGIEPHGIYLLCEGRAKVFKCDESGHQLTVRIEEPGALLGYRSLILGQTYAASVGVIEPSRVAFLDEQSFFALIRQSSALTLKLIHKMAERLGEAEDKALKMAFHGAYRRVAEILNSAKPSQPGKPNGHAPVMLPMLRRQDLADLAGLALETTIRVLKDMESKGLIRLKGKAIMILESAKLEQTAQPVH